MGAPKAHDWILDLKAYVPGKAKAEGVRNPVKLSANESAFGPSPKAVEAIKASAAGVVRYPDPASHDLIAAIADVHGLKAEGIVCGTGSGELLGLLIQSYAGPGDEVIVAEVSFSLYPIQVQAVGATLVPVPNKNWVADVDGILAAVTDKTKIVVVDNPNNPTGGYLPWSEIERLHAGLPEHVLLVLDGAYAECVTAGDFEAGEELVEKAENVAMTRTFSKLYALAGLRVGWMYASAGIIDVINRWRLPFNVSNPCQAAAVEAVRDQAYLNEVVSFTAQWRDWLTAELTAIGLDVIRSQTNFVTVAFPSESPFTASECNAYLTKHGYIVRALSVMPDHLRITVGTETQNRGLISLIRGFMNGSPDEAN
ncbi:MAG: histidinol-phosphate transaminase [Alphaproteobacteria bacterium]|nr:histidinol-phosphate transaminase [Alphaproteobacteria bacterium]